MCFPRLWSYAKLAIKNLDLFDSAADEIVKRGLDRGDPSNQSDLTFVAAKSNLFELEPCFLIFGARKSAIASASLST